MTKPKPLKKASASKRPDYGLSGGFLPRISTNCKDGLLIVREGKESIELKLPIEFECDFEAVQVRLRKFENGKMVDAGVYSGGAPDDDLRPTLVAPMYSDEPRAELSGAALGLRSYEAGAYSARESFAALDRQVYTELPDHPDEVAIVELTAFEESSMGGGRRAKRPTCQLGVQQTFEAYVQGRDRLRVPTAGKWQTTPALRPAKPCNGSSQA